MSCLWQTHNDDDNVLDNVVPFIKNEADDEQMLTWSSPSSFRQPSVPPLTYPAKLPPLPFAISTTSANQILNNSQDGRSILSSPPSSASLLSPGNNVGSRLPISSRQNVPSPLNNSPSLRTFTSPQELANHYGIPQFLPPVPRTTPNQQQPVTDFSALKSNYLSMLSNKPGESSSTAEPMPAEKSPEQVIQDLMEVLASPEFRDANSFEDFLTSPLMSTPYDTPLHDFSTSPNDDDSPFVDFLTTPVIQDLGDPLISDFGEFSTFLDAPLFGGLSDAPAAAAAPEASSSASNAKLPVIDMDKMYTISPLTPALDTIDPASVYPSPAVSMRSSFAPVSKPKPSEPSATATSASASTTSLAERRSKATGTRKHLSPSSLVPLDAPTQSRKYVLPSTTSRKDLPVTFARKRSRTQAFPEAEAEGGGGEIDELNDPQPPPNASEREQIEWKRRQNTLAARKSRKRKLEHQQFLESRVATLEKEIEVWKTRTVTMQSILRSHGIPVAEFEEEEA